MKQINIMKQVNLTSKFITKIPLSDICKSILLGSILGDGSLKIHKGYKNARFKMRHSIIQKEYFDWKVNSLTEISTPKSVRIQSADGFSPNNKVIYQSSACLPLTQLHSATYNQNKLRIRRRWLNHMTPLSLAIWWLDDGSIISDGKKGVICTDGFDENSVKLLARYLEKVWNVHARARPVSQLRRKTGAERATYYRLWLGSKQLKVFLRIILSHIPVPSMLSKVILLYNNPKLQQRWISEVKEQLPHFSQQVDVEYANKRQKWREFRK